MSQCARCGVWASDLILCAFLLLVKVKPTCVSGIRAGGGPRLRCYSYCSRDGDKERGYRKTITISLSYLSNFKNLVPIRLAMCAPVGVEPTALVPCSTGRWTKERENHNQEFLNDRTTKKNRIRNERTDGQHSIENPSACTFLVSYLRACSASSLLLTKEIVDFKLNPTLRHFRGVAFSSSRAFSIARSSSFH